MIVILVLSLLKSDVIFVMVFVVLSKMLWNSRDFVETAVARFFKDARTGAPRLSICITTSVANFSVEWFDVETLGTVAVLFSECVVLKYKIAQYETHTNTHARNNITRFTRNN